VLIRASPTGLALMRRSPWASTADRRRMAPVRRIRRIRAHRDPAILVTCNPAQV